MKPLFAPLPIRAISDQRLTALHLRVLAIIAWHDRLAESRDKGGGCWASHKTLCEEIGCNYTNLSTAINDLCGVGYLKRRVNPNFKTRWIYSVIYENSLPTGKHHPAKGLPVGKLDVCPPKKQTTDRKGKSPPNRTLNTFCETGNRFSEAASLSSEATLALFERRIRDRKISREDFKRGLILCQNILEGDEYGPDSPTWQRARRLYDYYCDDDAERG
jgi:hypothetical protein